MTVTVSLLVTAVANVSVTVFRAALTATALTVCAPDDAPETPKAVAIGLFVASRVFNTL